MIQAVFMRFSPYSGVGRTWVGGSPKGLVHNLQFFTLRNSKIEVFETSFSHTMST